MNEIDRYSTERKRESERERKRHYRKTEREGECVLDVLESPKSFREREKEGGIPERERVRRGQAKTINIRN